MNVRRVFYAVFVLWLLFLSFAFNEDRELFLFTLAFLPIFLLGFYDVLQKGRAILRNFPVIGHGRYLLELIRPEIQQYFIEMNREGRPFNREERSVIYQRAKVTLDTVPFGTQMDVYEVGYEWIVHSLAPKHVKPEDLRVKIGSRFCKNPYHASLFNISAMSYGSLSKNAVIALNQGARMGSFYHNTGEGGVSPWHLQGGDIVWQLGTAYFGARNEDGSFNADLFAEQAAHPYIKMIEIKLSQGAKPGHGGILPAAKLTKEIALIRKVPMGRDVLSPPAHTAFDSPEGLVRFIARLRDLSGGKPIGFKICIGKRREFLAICKAMVELQIWPDFITVDGGEGGTGAAPVEFTNRVGTPLTEGLTFVHNSLVGFGLRDEIKVIAAGKIATAFSIVKKLALGADLCNSARGMMMSLGCIQALSCNTNRCPTGVATQDPKLYFGLDPTRKSWRVASFQRETIKSVAELLGAMGVDHSSDVRPWHLFRRVGVEKIAHYGDLIEFLEPGSLLKAPYPASFARAMDHASAKTFDSQ